MYSENDRGIWKSKIEMLEMNLEELRKYYRVFVLPSPQCKDCHSSYLSFQDSMTEVLEEKHGMSEQQVEEFWDNIDKDICQKCGKYFKEEPGAFAEFFFKGALSDSPVCDECRNEIIETTTIKKVEITKALVKTAHFDCDDLGQALGRQQIPYTETAIETDSSYTITEYIYTDPSTGSTRYAYQKSFQYACDGWASVVCVYPEKLTKQEIASIDWEKI